MAGFQQGTGGVPPGAGGLAVRRKIPHTVHEVLPLHDDVAPGGPHRRLVRQGEKIAEGLAVLRVESGVQGRLHIVRPGGPLGVDVEHEEAVISVGQGDALGGL